MTPYLIELQSIVDWRSRLRDPNLHWKRGASAMELAIAWLNARRVSRGLPAAVAAMIDGVGELSGAKLKLAIPERATQLDTDRAPSQTDLWVLLEGAGGLIGLGVEGKAREPFGETVERWLRPPHFRGESGASDTRQRRLEFLCRHLGIEPASTPGLRYQLLHRTVACLIEARSWGARTSLMLVQRFGAPPANDRSWADFSSFASHLGVTAERGTIAKAQVPGDMPLYIGWLDCPFATDEQALAALADTFRDDSAANRQDPFEALCALASRENWCWKLGCTTCGCMHFRYGLRELALGRQPAVPGWLTRRRRNNLASRLGELPPFPFPPDEQRKIIDIAKSASISAIASSAKFPDWLGYLGFVLAFCEDAEAESGLLTRHWAPQLREMLSENSPMRQALAIKSNGQSRLSLGDLQNLEHELARA